MKPYRERRKTPSFCFGFTLVELSIVLVILSVIAGSGFAVATNYIERKKETDTQARLDIIEKALLDFRTSHNRLPCPANGTVNPDHQHYGVEAANPGTCSGGTPEVNFLNAAHIKKSGNTTRVVGGTIPVATLGLPKEIGIDGWGNKISYHVDAQATEISAFSTYTISNSNCFSVIIDDERTWADDSDLNYHSFHAAYALISHGKDGHGAFTIGGPRVNAGSANRFQQHNAQYDENGAALDYTNIFYNIAPTQDPDDDDNHFDDMLRFKTRAQLRTAQDGPGIIFPDIIVNTSTRQTHFYYRCGDRFIAEAREMVDMNQQQVVRTSIAPDNTHILAGLSSTGGEPFFSMWAYDGSRMHQLPQGDSFDPAITRSGSGSTNIAQWSPEGSYFIIGEITGTAATSGKASPAHDRGNRLSIYSKDGANRFSRVDGAIEYIRNSSGGYLMRSGTFDISLSPNGGELVVTYADGSIEPELFRRNPDNSFSHVPDALAGAPPQLRSPRWSPDGAYLMFRNSSQFITFRNDGNNTYSRTFHNHAYDGTIADISADSRFLAVATSGTKVEILQLQNDNSYLEVDDFTTSGTTQTLRFSPDGNYLAIGKNNGAMFILKREGGQFTLLSGSEGAETIPSAGNITHIEWRKPMPWERKLP